MDGSEDESRDEQKSLMEEALKILSQEGFTLPDDVVDTLQSVGRSNAASRRRGSLRGHRMCEVQSNTRKIRNSRESSGRRTSGSGLSDVTECTANGSASDYGLRNRENMETEATGSSFTRHGGLPEGSPPRGRLERQESGESSSTCTVSTVRENYNPEKGPVRPNLERQDSDDSIASSASSFARKQKGAERHSSMSSDTGYNTSLENAMQTHEARAQNLQNFNKQIDSKLSKRHGGLRRDVSRDSGFTESGFSAVSHSPVQAVGVPEKRPEANTSSTQDFNDFSVSNSDVSERFVSSDAGDAHTMMSTASDLRAAQMTSRSDELTEDGTAVSSVAKLENQDANSTMLRVTNKSTEEALARDEDYESVSKTSKSSRNDSISTTEDGVTTAASRHAASIEQGLYKESTKMGMSKDGRHTTSEMKVDQNLARNQQMNNIEQSDDGHAKEQSKQIAEKSLTSKSHREEKLKSEDGLTTGSLSASCNLDSSSKTQQSDETETQPDGTTVKRNNFTSSRNQNESNTSEQKTIKREPYSGASSTEIVKKSDKSSISESSRKVSEVRESPLGTSMFEESEDNKSVSSSFSGQCESTEVKNGVQMQRKTSSEKSCESTVKSSRSVSSYSSRRNTGNLEMEEHSGGSRRQSNLSDVSTATNLSNISRDNVNPPTYDETLSNRDRSRQQSVSSVFSRQDSTGSSIASSASAFNERQRQKMLAKSNMERQDSGESRRSGIGYNGDTGLDYGSDSVFSGDFEGDYHSRSRVINHPIRLVDSSTGTSSNRRATLQGDLALSERELNMARRDIRSNLRGRDDLFMDKCESNYSCRADRSQRRGLDEFDSFGRTSFKDEVMDMVDRFFDDDDDDDFGIGFGRRSDRRVDRLLNRESENPYTTREDLSKYRDNHDYVSPRYAEPEYAASESGYPVARSLRGSKFEQDDFDLSDSVSESGHRSYGRPRTSLSDAVDSGYSSVHQSAFKRGGIRSQYAHAHENTLVSREADDISRKAGKSIQNDRASISDRVGLKNAADKLLDSKNRHENNYGHYTNRYSGISNSAMDYNGVRSKSSEHYGAGQGCGDTGVARGNSRRGRELENTEGEDVNDSTKDAERKQRIGQALSWIRSELVSVTCINNYFSF